MVSLHGQMERIERGWGSMQSSKRQLTRLVCSLLSPLEANLGTISIRYPDPAIKVNDTVKVK